MANSTESKKKTLITFNITKTFEIDNDTIDSKLIKSMIEDCENSDIFVSKSIDNNFSFNKYLDVFEMIINKKLRYRYHETMNEDIVEWNHLFEGLTYFGSDLIIDLYKKAILQIYKSAYTSTMNKIRKPYNKGPANYDNLTHKRFQSLITEITRNHIYARKFTVFDSALYPFIELIDITGLNDPSNLIFRFKNQ